MESLKPTSKEDNNKQKRKKEKEDKEDSDRKQNLKESSGTDKEEETPKVPKEIPKAKSLFNYDKGFTK